MDGVEKPKKACDFCRRKKIRCNRELPRCQNCLVYNEVCHYSKRLKRYSLKMKCDTQAKNWQPLHESEDSPNYENSTSPDLRDNDSLHVRLRNVENKLDKLLSLVEDSYKPSNGFRPRDFPSLISQIRDASSLVDNKLQEYSKLFKISPADTNIDDLFAHSFPTWDKDVPDLPEQEWAIARIQWYFRFINCWWPVFYEGDFMAELQKLYLDPNQVKGVWLVSFYAVLALAISRSKIENDQKVSDSFFCAAWHLIQKPGFFLIPQVEKIQALIIMIQFTAHLSLFTLCKALCGQACLMIRDLNLHRASSTKKLPKKSAELYRRIFWVCYVFEITTSLVFGNPSVLSDMDIDCGYPEAEKEPLYPNIYHGDIIFIAEISLTILKNEIRSKLYSSNTPSVEGTRLKVIWSIFEKMQNWQNSLPLEIRNYFSSLNKNENIFFTLNSDEQRLFSACIEIYLSYCNTVIFLQRLNDTEEGSIICLETARRAVDVLKNFFVVLDPISKNVCYLWIFLYNPFTPFITLFSSTVSGKESNPDQLLEDLNRMYAVYKFFIKMRDLNGQLAQKLASVTENFIHAAEHYIALQPAFTADAFELTNFLI
ncbi:transcription factor [Schizosaccharomyces cryophilus OY26]|uniref:Transcription factor n=1 Tax=Schizosaccharomyces cryophilus (strain OY26 / ATCC MYA-4695 / CBS 11777 / NBRC 106824 / NRRL Y48691) TaxID=653667 RepID=S9W5M7_SCHCR|nr:transcription factor [Schizosaccharomyces cryophilus OY26]EPY53285.1 transcription factor [Schizosaccharomyces cryophilus OY26]